MTTFSHERALPERLALNHFAINRKEIVMNNILVLNSSVSREDSVSRVLIDEALTRLHDADPQAAVISSRSRHRSDPPPDYRQSGRHQWKAFDSAEVVA